MKLNNCQEHVLSQVKGKTLDIGCGKCKMLIEGYKRKLDMEGCDSSTTQIKYGFLKSKEEKTTIVTHFGDIYSLPFKTETYNTILMMEILEHLPDPVDAIKRVLPLLKKGGKLIITTPCGFAHYDPGHVSFFFMNKDLDRLNKLWAFDMLPIVIRNCIKGISMEKMCSNLLNEGIVSDVIIDEREWKDSEHKSLDFLITMTK